MSRQTCGRSASLRGAITLEQTSWGARPIIDTDGTWGRMTVFAQSEGRSSSPRTCLPVRGYIKSVSAIRRKSRRSSLAKGLEGLALGPGSWSGRRSSLRPNSAQLGAYNLCGRGMSRFVPVAGTHRGICEAVQIDFAFLSVLRQRRRQINHLNILRADRKSHESAIEGR